MEEEKNIKLQQITMYSLKFFGRLILQNLKENFNHLTKTVIYISAFDNFI